MSDITLSEPPTLDELTAFECQIWNIPHKGQRTLFDSALNGVINSHNEDIDRESFVGECVGALSGRPAKSQRYATAVTASLAGQGIETLPALREHHSDLHEQYFELMNERRARGAERYRQMREGTGDD